MTATGVGELVDRLADRAPAVVAALRTAVLRGAAASGVQLVDGGAGYHVERLVPVVLECLRTGASLGPDENRLLQEAGRDMAARGVPLATSAAALREAVDTFGREVLGSAEPDLHLAAVTVLDRAVQLSHEVSLALVTGFATAPRESVLAPTARRVLELAAAGHSSRRIADELHYSEQTVTYHLGRLMKEYGVPNRTALVALAVRRRWIRVDAGG